MSRLSPLFLSILPSYELLSISFHFSFTSSLSSHLSPPFPHPLLIVFCLPFTPFCHLLWLQHHP
ncbi:hypothetical protein F5I97DRAFT_1913694 [Phlebopus sp. FC_14]|nr:hypothetical protein F5I97DRAFT_1913694 [Phlebopus sp. FC_14]